MVVLSFLLMQYAWVHQSYTKKCNRHFTFKLVIDSWGMCSDKNINGGALISFDAVCLGPPVNDIQESKQTSVKQVNVVLLLKTRCHAAS